jgi:soluble lytic murein transglycosylase-like protein
MVSTSPAAELAVDGGDGFAARLAAELALSRGRLLFASLATAVAAAVIVSAGSTHHLAPIAAPMDPAAGASVASPLAGDADSWLVLARSAVSTTCPGLSPEVLVAIAQVESRLGTAVAPSRAGAQGPMQFLPGTWAAYGTDGDGDGTADVNNPVDAMHGAARLLCANGGADPNRLGSALWNYNHSSDYVRGVLRLATPRGLLGEDS